MNTMVDLRRNPQTDEILQRNGNLFKEKFISSLDKVLAVSRYSREDTLSELGFGTQVFLTIVQALANKDLYLCVTLLKLVESVSLLHTANRYMVHQMLEIFQISPLVIQGAVQYLEILEESRLFNIPSSIGTMLRHASDIVEGGQSAKSIPTNERSSAIVENPEDEVESSRTEPSEALEIVNEREGNVNVMEQAEDLPNPRDLLQIIKLCVLGRGCKTEEGDSHLHICVRNKSICGVKVLLDLGYEVNVKNNDYKTSLMLAVEMGHLEIVDLLLQNGSDPNISDKNNDTPLFVAAGNGDLEIIRKLVDKGAGINDKKSGFSVLVWAVKKSKKEAAILLKELGANLSSDDIINAAKNCDASVMELLVELGADINVTDSDGKTPLHLAVDNKNESLVKYLLKAGAELNTKGSNGKTPLHLAVDNNNESIVRYLVEAGAELNTASFGRTPLHTAVDNKNESLVKYLLKAGAELNTTGADGKTPLHLAVDNNNESIVRYLVEAGAELNTASFGRTPLGMSRDPQISAYLQSKGARK